MVSGRNILPFTFPPHLPDMVFHPDELVLCVTHVTGESATDSIAKKTERNMHLMKALEEVALNLGLTPKTKVVVMNQLKILRKTPSQLEDHRQKERDRSSLNNPLNNPGNNAINNPLRNPLINPGNNAKTSLKKKQESAEWLVAQAALGRMRSPEKVYFFNAVLYVTCCY